MENFSYHVPVYVVTGGVDLSGYSADLTPGQVGLFDRATFSVATSTGTGKEFFFAQGSIGGKDWYGQPVTESVKSPFFNGVDVHNMYMSTPKRIKNEQWIIGYNGAQSSQTLTFETGKAFRLKMYFHGQPIYRFFGGPKEYVVSYTPEVPCAAPCSGSDCPDPIDDCLVHTQNVINLINTHVELQKFGVTAKLVDHPFVADTITMTKYCISLCDEGDVYALQAIQAEYPGTSITRIDREGSSSTYQMCISADADSPADFTQSGSILLATCGTCPVGSTLVPATDVYFIIRPLSDSDDVSTPSAQQTYADAVAANYVISKTFTANSSSVNISTNVITINAHEFSNGDPVVYSNGGGTSIAGLTTTDTYYIINAAANTFKLAATPGGAAIDLTSVGAGASQSFSTSVTADSFISNSGGTAIVKLTTPSGTTLNAYHADTVQFAFTNAASCSFSAPADVSWASCGTGISSSQQLTLQSIKRNDCTNTAGDRLAEISATISGVQGIDISTLAVVAGDGCSDDYTVTQNSIDCLADDCLTNNVTFTYDDLPAFENSYWKVVPPTVDDDDTRKCGIRISAGYIDPKFGNCSFVPDDYYETMPLKMEVSLLQEDGDNCDAASWPTVQQTQIGQIARQSGEYIVREVIMKNEAYLRHALQFSIDSRDREAFAMNLLGSVDRKAFYNIYYVTFRASYGNSFRKNEIQEKFTAMFAFKEGDASEATFRSAVIDTLTAKSGVTLHIND